jgi:DNA-binding MarR family transcriptional regulator
MMLLSADQRRALVMLATAGRAGVARALQSAHGFDAIMIAGLVHRGLATLTMKKVLASGKLTAVAMVRITEAGRRVLAAAG